MGIIIYFFEIPIVGIIMLLAPLLGIDVGWLCRWIGSMWAVVGSIVALWCLIGGEPWSSKEDRNWFFRIIMIIVLVIMFTIPGVEVYKVGVGMGDKKLIEMLLGR